MCPPNTTSTSTTTTTTNHMNCFKEKRIAIVGGGGISGLQTIRSLKARGFENVVAYEGSHDLGGIWKQNYSNVSVQVPRALFEFPDFPMSDVDWNGYATGPQVQRYMEDYADRFQLRDWIVFGAFVTKIARMNSNSNSSSSNSSFWQLQVQTRDKTTTELFDYVIVAAGLYSASNQFIPQIKGMHDHFQGQVIHSCQFYNAAMAQNKRVVVIGGGKSAIDIAVEAAKHNNNNNDATQQPVTLLPREMHWPSPRKLLGIIPTHWILMSRLGTALVCTQTATFPRTKQEAIHNHSISHKLWTVVTRPIYKIYEMLVAWQFKLHRKLLLYPQNNVIQDFYNIHYNINDDLTNMRKKGKINLQVGEIVQFQPDGDTLLLKDGSTLKADLVVSATGFQENYDIFDHQLYQQLDIQDDGVYMYRFMIPPKVPHMAFVGHVNAVSNIGTYGLQAEWLARYLTGELTEMPPRDQNSMMQEIEQHHQQWARSFMPKTKVRGMTILLHQTQYWDRLLMDMGINPHRKTNIFAEYFMVYGPSDYNGIIGGSNASSTTSSMQKKIATRPWTWY